MITLSITSLSIFLSLAALSGYGYGYWRRHHEVRSPLPRLEWPRPLPRYMHRIHFEPIEHRPTVRIIREEPSSVT